MRVAELADGAGTVRTSRTKIFIHGMNFAPEPIGVGRYTGELAEFLAAQGEFVEVVTSLPHYPGWQVKPPYRRWQYAVEMRNGVRIIRCPLLLHASGRGIWRLLAPLSFAISAAPTVIWRILRSRPDVVICIQPTLLSAPAAVVAAKIVGARRILHIQDLEIDAAFEVGHLSAHWLRRTATAFERFMLRRFTHVITISDRTAQKLAIKGVSSNRISVFRNWVNTSKIRPMIGPNRFREQLGLAEQDFVVFYSGHIGRKQAVDRLAAAALECRDQLSIHFVICGDGPEKRSLIDAYGAVPNVHFLPIQPEEKLCELLNLADLHVLPQERSAADLVLPSKLGGMLASGRAILVTADPGNELYDLLSGIATIVPPGNVGALADAIKSISTQLRQPPAMIADHLASLFSSEVVLPQFYQAIRNQV
jgi:colanic acid biosynthesis glycosyl transferase WcaI